MKIAKFYASALLKGKNKQRGIVTFGKGTSTMCHNGKIYKKHNLNKKESKGERFGSNFIVSQFFVFDSCKHSFWIP